MSAELDRVVQEIQALAQKLGEPPHRMTIAKFRAEYGCTNRERRHYGQAKRIASGQPADQAQAPPVLPVPLGHGVKGVSTYVDKDGNVKGQWIKSRAEGVDPEDLIKRLGERIKDTITVRSSRVKAPRMDSRASRLLAIYPLGDPHLGLKTPDHGLSDAVRMHQAAMDALSCAGLPAHEALLLDLGDSMHVDLGKHNATTKGTPQDTDGLWWEIVLAAVDLKVYQIDRLLEQHKRVTVWNVAGNHDKVGAFAVALALHRHYRKEPRVQIPINPRAVWYMQHGECMIASSHGDTIRNVKDMVLAAAHDAAAMWGLTKHRYWYGGHVHHRSVKEEAGMVVETFRTLAPQDSWHDGQGYRAGQDTCKIWLDQRRGEIARSTINASAL